MCNHKDNEEIYTIKYDSDYERRKSQMYCIQCNESINGWELPKEEMTKAYDYIHNNKICK